MTTITQRKANREDLPAIIELYVQAGLEQEEKVNLSDSERVWERMQQYPAYAVYLAVQAGEVVGTFALLIMDNLAHHGTPAGIVEDVAVSPAHQGQGIGTAMMQFAMEECSKAECYKLSLSSNLKREAAHQFYEGLGFIKHGYSFVVEMGAAVK